MSTDTTLNETDAVRHVQGILVRRQTDERFLLAIRTDERVHFLNLLHRALRVKREEERLKSVSALRMRGALARVFRVARKTQRLGAVERRRRAHLAHALLTRVTLLHHLLGDVRLTRGNVLLACVVSICSISTLL